jgi:hypothetical protein
MRPSLIYEILTGDTELQFRGISNDRVIESQSIDSRPFSTGYFITVNMEEGEIGGGAIQKGPRNVTFAVHHPMEADRDYGPVTDILNCVDRLLRAIDDDIGSDGVRVSQVRRGARSGNLIDEGWNTIKRTATFGVSYNEYLP